jgi:GH24 family phage-related lysozyme (muramidase)
MTDVSNQYLDEAISKLFSCVGVKNNFSYSFLYQKLKKGDVKGCIKEMAEYLGLLVKINILSVFSI